MMMRVDRKTRAFLLVFLFRNQRKYRNKLVFRKEVF